MPDLANSVTIAITTKDRWSELRSSLEHLVDVGLGRLPLIVADDGSAIACPFSFSFWLGPVAVRRVETQLGLIEQRNRLATLIPTKYALSLDDDSYPVAGCLTAAVKFAEQTADLLCAGFPIYNPLEKSYQSQSTSVEPYPVRAFIGCGHLMHLPRFRALGGYRAELTHQGEEADLAARGFLKGLRCYHFPGLLIHHLASNAGRSWQRMDYFGSRNVFLWNDWFVPPLLRPFQQTRTFLGRTRLFLQLRRRAIWQGQVEGLLAVRKYRAFRQSFSWEQYRAWRELKPH